MKTLREHESEREAAEEHTREWLRRRAAIVLKESAEIKEMGGHMTKSVARNALSSRCLDLNGFAFELCGTELAECPGVVNCSHPPTVTCHCVGCGNLEYRTI